jgi:hypothetical protein
MEKMALARLNPDGSPAKRIILVINKVDLVCCGFAPCLFSCFVVSQQEGETALCWP